MTPQTCCHKQLLPNKGVLSATGFNSRPEQAGTTQPSRCLPHILVLRNTPSHSICHWTQRHKKVLAWREHNDHCAQTGSIAWFCPVSLEKYTCKHETATSEWRYLKYRGFSQNCLGSNLIDENLNIVLIYNIYTSVIKCFDLFRFVFANACNDDKTFLPVVDILVIISV